jgi:hypothetical protein
MELIINKMQSSQDPNGKMPSLDAMKQSAYSNMQTSSLADKLKFMPDNESSSDKEFDDSDLDDLPPPTQINNAAPADD